MKGYKGFEKGLICKGKRYAENTIFEEDNAVICISGMHFCRNPLDVLSYYPLLNNNGELNDFAEVEALDECITDDDKKYCTKKLKIGERIEVSALIKASIDFMIEMCKESGDGSQSAQSGYGSQSAQSGSYSKSAQSGSYSKSAQSGYGSKSAQSGNGSQSAQSGNGSKSAQSGNGSSIDLQGRNCVGASIGKNCKIKGVIGSWITLAEYDNDNICICVKSAQIDGKQLKENTWYTLKDGEFVEIKED